MTDLADVVRLNSVLAAEADWFSARLRDLDGARRHRVPDYAAVAREQGVLARPVTWTNVIVSTPVFRRAHVELFEIQDQIAVLHLCIFPRPETGLPILGFDVIAGQARATGGFLDLSPVDPASSVVSRAWQRRFGPHQSRFAEHRALPDWGDIFSPGVVAIRPTSPQEAENLFSLGRATFKWLIACEPGEAASNEDLLRALAGQRRYIAAQRRNEHTFRMLRGCVGDDLAREFIDRWLFPDPDET